MARNEVDCGVRQRLRRVALRRMSARGKDDDLGLPCAFANALDLRERAVFVVRPLHRQYGASQLAEQWFD